MSDAEKSNGSKGNGSRGKPGPPPGEGGAPKKSEAKVKGAFTGVRMTKAMRARVDRAAEEDGVSAAEVVRRAIRSYFDL